MSSIQSLLESANPWKSLQSDAGKLASKWVKTGLLENLSELDKNNMCNCEMCGIKNKANKQTLLWKTPKVLIIHFKRFIVNNYGVTTKKLINEII